MGVHKWSVNTPMVTFLFVFPPYQGCLCIQAYTLIYIKFCLNILCVCNYTFKMPDQTSFGCSNAKSDRCSKCWFNSLKTCFIIIIHPPDTKEPVKKFTTLRHEFFSSASSQVPFSCKS